MHLTRNIKFKNFIVKTPTKKIKNLLSKLLSEKNEVLLSLSKGYKNSYIKKKIIKFKSYSRINIIGMGGSILGAKAIYNFLKINIDKKFFFIDGFRSEEAKNIADKKKLNIIISKSGNTLETIVNSNILINNKDENIFITENKKSYLNLLAKKLKSDIIHHNNFIGGRYSVLSEVGMLPAELMGLNPDKFRCLNNLVNNKNFLNALISNVNSTIYFAKNRKFNSVIINYDHKSESLFDWYQQLIAESLGKKKKGILPIVSNMPKDNHSVMQLYLDGFNNNFFTFFYVKEKNSIKIDSNKLLLSEKYLKNKSLDSIIYAQKKATENVFIKKKIPFRSFEIKKRDEKSLGELFCFFILETILLGKALNLNPYDQPAVELIKIETKKLLT